MKIRAATEGHLPHVRKTSSHHVGPFAVAARIHSAKSGVVGVASDRRDFSASASMWKAGCFPVGLRTNGPSFQSRATASDNRQPESQRPSNNGKPTEGRRLAAVDCFAEVAKCGWNRRLPQPARSTSLCPMPQCSSKPRRISATRYFRSTRTSWRRPSGGSCSSEAPAGAS